MKKSILLYLVFLPGFVFAQFPAPDSFQISVRYITMDESGWCDAQWVQGPAYCNWFFWKTPDTANFPGSLTGYRIYNDGQIFLSATSNEVWLVAALMGSFYVTAIYESPAGESDFSNVVEIGDLPMPTGEAQKNNNIEIGFDLSQQVLIIQGAEYARGLRVFDMQGRLVFFTDAVPAVQRLDGLRSGVYWVLVQGRFGGVTSKVFCLVK